MSTPTSSDSPSRFTYRPVSPAPWHPFSDSSSPNTPDSPKTPKFTDLLPRSPSPFVAVNPTFWPQHQMMWLDLIYKSNDEMKKFMGMANEIKNADIIELPRSVALQPSQGNRWCVRIATHFEKMEAPLTVLFETYPDLYPYLFPVIVKQIKSEA